MCYEQCSPKHLCFHQDCSLPSELPQIRTLSCFTERASLQPPRSLMMRGRPTHCRPLIVSLHFNHSNSRRYHANSRPASTFPRFSFPCDEPWQCSLCLSHVSSLKIFRISLFPVINFHYRVTCPK